MKPVPPSAEAEIVGRERELEQIATVRGDGEGLLLDGEPGIGKTTLWRAGVELLRRGGSRVLEASPAEAERTLSYSVLGDLLEPCSDEVFSTLAAAQRRALESVVLVLDDVEVTYARVVGIALRNGLRALSASGPVVVAIDDVQWVDAASAAALGFALRRVGDAPVSVFAAVRRGHPLPFELAAAKLDVEPFSLGGLHHLLVERLGAALPRTAMVRLHAISGGNPFYALELARASPSGGGELVFPESLQELVANRLRGLPKPVRRSLELMALAGGTPPNSNLDAAVDAGLIKTAEPAPRFAHPLFAEAAVALLTPTERRKLHREIAERTAEPEQRARHLAHAARGPDEQVSRELAAAAERAAGRGAIAASAELWELAATLTPPDAASALHERLVEAGIAHILAGDIDLGAAMTDANLAYLPPGPLRERALVHRALAHGQEDISATIPLLERALAEVEVEATRLRIVGFLSTFHAIAGDTVRAGAVAAEYLRAAKGAESALLTEAMTLSAHFQLLLDRDPQALLHQLAERTPSNEAEPWFSQDRVHAFAHLRAGRTGDARASLEQALARLDDHGEDIWRGTYLSTLVEIELTSGRFAAAEQIADEMLSHSEQLSTPHMISLGLSLTALTAALLGRTDEARKMARRSLEVAEQVGSGLATSNALFTLGLLELSLGQAEEAAAIYQEVPDPSWRRWSQFAGGRTIVDAVEALTATDQLERARELTAILPHDAREQPIAQAHLAAADRDLERAIALTRSAPRSPAPFRQARELLLLGTLLRRTRHRSDARRALTRSLEQFQQLGAPLWANRAQDEIARLGGRTPSGRTLTASERRVAELVAGGLSNKEVATRLVVTVGTVEAHLSKIYSKLGIATRTALAARWADSSEHDPLG